MCTCETESRRIEQLILGEKEGFLRLVNEYGPKLKGLLHKQWPNLTEEDREEIVQDTFLAVEEQIQRFDQSQSFSAWITIIAINKCRDLWRKQERERQAQEPQDVGDDPSLVLPLDEIHERLKRALPLRSYQILKWSGLGFSQRQMAEWLGTNENNVKQIKCRAVKVLRELVAQYMPARKGGN